MRTSAPGPAADGFTLVELLVVLAIVGTAAAAVLLAWPDRRGSLVAEAERFAARVHAAQERAIIGAWPVALHVEQGSYGFRRYAGGEWRPLQSWRWGEGVQGSDAQSVFDSTGISEPVTVTLRRGGEAVSVEIKQDGGVHVRR